MKIENTKAQMRKGVLEFCILSVLKDEDADLEIGLLFSFSDAAGGELPGMVISFDDDDVEVDFNHPLAGRTIMFDVLIHRVEPTELH